MKTQSSYLNLFFLIPTGTYLATYLSMKWQGDLSSNKIPDFVDRVVAQVNLN